jgi:hypothetical protein
VDAIKAAGYWADFIDPCTGSPVIGTAGPSIYSEVEGMHTLLRYRSEVCQPISLSLLVRFLLHPSVRQLKHLFWLHFPVASRLLSDLITSTMDHSLLSSIIVHNSAIYDY